MSARLAIVNHVWDADLASFEDVLARYTTLTGWSEAAAAAGASSVTVYQRFRVDDRIERNGVTYIAVKDADAPRPPSWTGGDWPIHAAVASGNPDIVHMNGVMHPRWIRRLRDALPVGTALAVQDHGGFDPTAASSLKRQWIYRGLSAADALLVSSPGQADQWRESGVAPPGLRIFDVMESSRTLAPLPADEARRLSGVDGSPSMLWVGRLNHNKDPLTVLRGAAAFFDRCPGARMTFVYAEADLESEVRELVAKTPALATRVRLVGRVPYRDMAAYFSAADLYVAGSHREGSGYAAIEAIACGALPVLTDIAPFRALTADGSVGLLWRTGDPSSLSDALTGACRMLGAGQRIARRDFFDRAFSWRAIGRRSVEIYGELLSPRSTRPSAALRCQASPTPRR